MLKIKDNVDLKELEKFGFSIQYDVYDGKPKDLIQKWGYPYCDNIKKPFIKFIKRKKCNIKYLNVKSYFGMDIKVPDNHLNREIFLNTIYDLIKADLVEKVDD